jgi:hypothetical protein
LQHLSVLAESQEGVESFINYLRGRIFNDEVTHNLEQHCDLVAIINAEGFYQLDDGVYVLELLAETGQVYFPEPVSAVYDVVFYNVEDAFLCFDLLVLFIEKIFDKFAEVVRAKLMRGSVEHLMQQSEVNFILFHNLSIQVALNLQAFFFAGLVKL